MKPKYIQIETISVCNQRCYFCPVSMDKRTRNTLPLERVEQIIAGLHDYPVEVVAISGFTEPTFDKQLVEKVMAIRDAGYKVSIYSNGSGLKPALTDRLLATGVSSFTFNLSTLDETQYKQTRGTKDLHRVLPNLDYLLAQPQVQNGDTEVTVVVVGALDAQHAENIQMIRKRFANTAVAKIWIIPMVEFAGKKDQGLLPVPVRHEKLRGCLWQRDQKWMHFDAKGEAIFCCHDYFSDYKMGNISKMSVDEIYRGEPVNQWRRWLSGEEEAPDNFMCRRCAYAVTDNHADYLRQTFCSRCVLPDLLGGVEHSCQQCGDVGLVLNMMEKRPELYPHLQTE